MNSSNQKLEELTLSQTSCQNPQKIHSVSMRQVRICNCPCVKQIQHFETMLSLQSQLARSLELENLRRNQQRLYLQAEIKQLRMELEQPLKWKRQLQERINYLKSKSQLAENNLKRADLKLHQKDKIISAHENRCLQLQNFNKKLQFQHSYGSSQNEQLKMKLNETYKKINQNVTRQRKSSITLPKNEQRVEDIIDKINSKWEIYCEQVKQKLHSDSVKKEDKFETMLDEERIKLEKCQAQLKIKIQELKKEKNNSLQLQKNIKKTEEQIKKLNSNISQLQNALQNKNNTYEYSIIKLQKQILTNNQQINNLRSIQQNKSIQKESYCSQTEIEQEQILELPMIKHSSSLRNDQKDDKIQYLTQQLKQRQAQIRKLQSKLASLSKINQLYKENNDELMHKGTINQLNSSKNKDSEDNKLLNSAVLNTVIKQYAFEAKQIKKKMEQMQEKVQEKDKQIEYLEEANSNLKKMKIQSIQLGTKISALQRQNFQLKRTLGASNADNMRRSRIARTQINGGSKQFSGSQASQKIGNTQNGKTLSYLVNRTSLNSLLKPKPKGNKLDMSYYSHYQKQDTSQSEQEFNLQQINGVHDLGVVECQTPTINDKLKINRNYTKQSDNQKKSEKTPCVNFVISVVESFQEGGVIKSQQQVQISEKESPLNIDDDFLGAKA